MQRILMIIAQKDFRDEEFFDTKASLIAGNIEVEVATPEKKQATGSLGGSVIPDLNFSDVNLDRYDGIVLIGGGGAFDYIDDVRVHRFVKKMLEYNRLIAAICIAPAILAKAGVLFHRRATVHSSGVDYLEKEDAIYTGNDIEEDRNLITANGPAVASLFGKKIANYLNK